MDDTWTADLLLQDTVIVEFGSSQHTLDKAQQLLDSVRHTHVSLQLKLAVVQREWFESLALKKAWENTNREGKIRKV